MKRYTKLTPALTLALVLGACSDGTETGGGAGDNFIEPNPDAVALVSQLTGLYQLPDNWAGLPGSEAYLEIREPNIAGEAEAVLYRASLSNNCVERSLSPAQVVKDISGEAQFGERVFLNRLFELEDSILSRPLNTTNLIIDLARDIQDIDGDRDEREPAQLVATLISDLPEICM